MNCRMNVLAAVFAWMPFVGVAATHKVANVAELEEAVWKASADDVIQLTNTALRVYDLSTTTHKGTPGHLYTASQITLEGATTNPEDTVIRGSGNRILYLGGQRNTIRNLTFENGDVTEYQQQTAQQPYDYPRGGAIIFSRSNAGTVSNCIFRNNKASLAGGAVASYTAKNTTTASFVDCVFSNNVATADEAKGGAVYMVADVLRCHFENNSLSGSSSLGGAIYNARKIEDCMFKGNLADDEGGAVYFEANTATPSPVVSGCTFTGNCSAGSGSAISAVNTLGESLLVTNCTFKGNGPLTTGGTLNGTIANLANVVDCKFLSNTAKFGGAAHTCMLKGCLMEGNSATDVGGAAYGSTLVACTNRANVNASTNVKASELGPNCSATDCLFENIGNSAKFAFDGGTYDRCRFVSVTNGYLFSGSFALTNCLIADSSNCYLFYKSTDAARMFNVTIVNNTFAGFKTSHTCGKMVIENTFFYGNSLGKGKYDIDQNAPNAVGSFNHCIFSAADSAYAPGEDNLNYYGTSFRPGSSVRRNHRPIRMR